MRNSALLLALGTALLFPLTSRAQDQRIILDLTVNAVPHGEVVAILRDDREVLVQDSDLEKAGLHNLAGRRETIQGKIYLVLSSVGEDLTYEIDIENFKLRLTAKPDLFEKTVIDFQSKERPSDVEYRKDSSTWTNYALFLNSQKDFNAFFENGVNIESTLLLNELTLTSDRDLRRGLTNLTVDEREAMRRWVIGDRIVSSGGLGGGVVLGGVSVSREFSLDPYFVRFPGIGLSGVTRTPSTLDTYLNGTFFSRQELPPGPFEIRNLPIPVGSGSGRFIVRDVFGREQEFTSSFYLSSGVLAAGLSDFHYHLGFRRNQLGFQNWDYDSPGFIGVHRLGLSDWITGGLRLESSAHVVSGGPTLTARLFESGEVEISGALSRDDGQKGKAGLFGYTYITRTFGANAAFRIMSRRYATLSLRENDDRALLDGTAGLSVPIGSRASASLQYGASKSRDAGTTQRIGLIGSVQLGHHLNLFATVSHTRGDSIGNTTTAFSGINYSFGEGTNAHLSWDRSSSGSTAGLDVSRPAPLGEGFGYRLNAQRGAVQLVDGSVQYQGAYGQYKAGYQHTEDNDVGTAQASGGLVWMGGRFFATRPVQDAFAVIEVPGVKDVRGFVNNQEAGRTDRDGDLLIPVLLSYNANRIGISDQDIPMTHRIDQTEMKIAPPYRGGALVRFPVMKVTNATGKVLILAQGKSVLPVYGQLNLSVGKETVTSPIGSNGEFYLENLSPGVYEAEIEYAEGICKLPITVPPVDKLVIDLGTLRCTVPDGPP